MQTSPKIVPLTNANSEPGPEERFNLQRDAVRLGKSRDARDRIGLPPRYAGKSLANFEGAATLKEQALTALQSGNVFLWGPCGTGKTHLAVALLNHAVAERLQYNPKLPSAMWSILDALKVRFVSCQSLIFEMKEAIRDDASDTELIDDLLKLELVAIDDFCASRLTDYAKEMLAYLVERIYSENRRGVIFTSNLSLQQIAETLDDRTASRLAEMCKIFKLDGPDRRVQPRN